MRERGCGMLCFSSAFPSCSSLMLEAGWDVVEGDFPRGIALRQDSPATLGLPRGQGRAR